MFSRKDVAEAAKGLADHLQLIENVKALQGGQKVLADALAALGDRIRKIEMDMSVLKAETKFEALKETQIIINSVQGGLNQRIEDIAVKVAILNNGGASMRQIDDVTVPRIAD